MVKTSITRSLDLTPDLSRRHHLHRFSQKVRGGWKNILRKVDHISHLNTVSSNYFQNVLSGLADVIGRNWRWGHWG
jgi:hypothetical protein